MDDDRIDCEVNTPEQVARVAIMIKKAKPNFRVRVVLTEFAELDHAVVDAAKAHASPPTAATAPRRTAPPPPPIAGTSRGANGSAAPPR